MKHINKSQHHALGVALPVIILPRRFEYVRSEIDARYSLRYILMGMMDLEENDSQGAEYIGGIYRGNRSSVP